MSEKRKRMRRKRGPRKGARRRSTVGNSFVSTGNIPNQRVGGYGGSIMIANTRSQWPIGRTLRARGDAQLTVRQTLAGLSMATHTGFSGNDIFIAPTAGFGVVMNHSLNDLAQVASFQAIFDQYKFEEVEIRLVPLTPFPGLTQTSNDIPGLSQFVLDFDDGSVLGSENAAMEYDTCQTAASFEEVHIKYRPAVAPAYFTSGAFSGYGVAPSDGVWLDSASPSILHYGVKGWIGNLNTGSTSQHGWSVRAQYTVSFRNVR